MILLSSTRSQSPRDLKGACRGEEPSWGEARNHDDAAGHHNHAVPDDYHGPYHHDGQGTKKSAWVGKKNHNRQHAAKQSGSNDGPAARLGLRISQYGALKICIYSRQTSTQCKTVGW